MVKKILFYGGLATGLYYAFKGGGNIFSLQNIEAEIKKIVNINIAKGKLIIVVDLNLINKSNFNFGLDTFNLLSLKKIKFYNTTNRLLIGVANVSISNITIPSKNITTLKNIKAEIPLKNVIENLSLFTAGNIADNVGIVPVFNAAGKEFEINPNNYV